MREAEVVIRPPGRWPGLGLRELARHRELLFFLAKRELQVRYKQSFFGVAWAVMLPVGFAAVFAIISLLIEIPTGGVPYPLFAVAGLVPWFFIAQGVGQSAASLVGEANLLGKVYFPRMALPLAKIGSFFADLLIGVGVICVGLLLYGVAPTWGLVLLPIFMLIALATVVGLGLLLAALNVRYRDIAVAIPIGIQMWLFATPVLYPGQLIEGGWRYVYALNPAVSVIEGVRWAFVGTRAPLVATVAISSAVALVLLVVGFSYFRSRERNIADIV